ncbi:MAG: hypothetical protein RL708_396 [Bacteroidota bacterium]
MKHLKQKYAADCGPTCLKMVADSYGKNISINKLRELCELNREGVSLLGISKAAEAVGFRSLGVKIDVEKLINDAPLPCILHWNQNHFVVLYKIKKRNAFLSPLFWRRVGGEVFYLADPGHGLVKLTTEQFKKSWTSGINNQGIAMLLEPKPEFYATPNEDNKETNNKKGFRFLFSYLKGYKAYIAQVLIGLLGVSILQLLFPFITQGVVDRGIHFKDINFVVLMLIAQLMLLAGQTAIEFIRSWILLHISSRINITLISDFLSKLIKLPHSFFESRTSGDILQRIGDHSRVQSFITQNSLMTLFSFFNFLVFGIVLCTYDVTLFGVFMLFSILYIVWIVLFLKKRKELDYKRFNASSQNQNKMLQLINGIHEIKLYNAENHRRWEWEKQQVQLFHIGLSGRAISQYQEAGAFLINQLKNILLTFIAAKAVIDGNMSLGMMMSVQYIIGQLNSPIQQFIGFVIAAQDAKISLDRIGEIYQEKDEQQLHENLTGSSSSLANLKSSNLGDIELKDVCFRYPGMSDAWVLDNINLKLPQGKITAIVGSSGSGKTTLLKLLLKYHSPNKGKLTIDNFDISQIHPHEWRNLIAAVMQDGFIFGDTVAGNIVVDGSTIDTAKLKAAVETAQIREFIETLPLGYNTKIGAEGISVSMGQRQRLLIARAIYKNPEIILFDEATNSLDANNERKIVEGLEKFYKNKTVVIVAHRLSTVKHADNIVVLEKGKIVEQGTHEELIKLNGNYYMLVKNQLELGT